MSNEKRMSKAKILTLRKREIEPWIYSYSDLVTNLLALFMMLFIVFVRGEEARKKLQDSLRDYSQAKKEDVVPEEDIRDPAARRIVSEYIRNNGLESKVSLETLQRGVELTFEGSLVFDDGSKEINEDAIPVLRHVAKLIKMLPAGYVVDVEGHTDTKISEESTYSSNWELSSARAASVAQFLEDTGFPSKRIRVHGFSDTRQVAKTGRNTDLNRRVAIKINAEYGGVR